MSPAEYAVRGQHALFEPILPWVPRYTATVLVCLFCVAVSFRLREHVCFCCIRLRFFNTVPSDWLGRTSLKWALCSGSLQLSWRATLCQLSCNLQSLIRRTSSALKLLVSVYFNCYVKLNDTFIFICSLGQSRPCLGYILILLFFAQILSQIIMVIIATELDMPAVSRWQHW